MSMRRFKLTYCSLLLIICAVFLQSCARKTIQSVERSTDSVVIVKTDSVMVRDTIVVVSKMEKTDSVVDRMNTYVVVDTTGKVIYKYVYRDRNVTRNRDSSNMVGKSSVSELKQQNKSENKSSKNDFSKVVTKKGKSLAKSIALILFIVFLLWFYAIRKK